MEGAWGRSEDVGYYPPIPTPRGRRAFTILPALARNKADHNGTYSDVFDLQEWSFLQIILDVYATSVTDAGDYLDVSIEMSTNKVLYVQAGAFAQLAGNAVASRHVMSFVTALAVVPNASFPLVTAANVVNERTFGRYIRARIGITDGDANAVHQFKVTGYVSFPPPEEE